MNDSRSIGRFWQSISGRIGLGLTGFLFAIALLAPFVRPYNPSRNFKDRLLAPSLTHPFGTDGLGRDLLTYIWHGIQTSLLISLVSVGVGALIGLSLGLLAGYFRGWIDAILSWMTDILLAFPSILLAIAIVTVSVDPSLKTVILAVGVVQIPIYIRLTRSVVLSLREQEFVQAAKALGATTPQIILKHILPGSLAPIIVQASLSLGTATLEAAGLGFLGLGAPPPTPELGTILADAVRDGYLRSAPWTTIFPGIAITLIVLAFNLLGDGLRDGFDPRSR
ncbi:MAG: ABC transporter permease [Leptolyngbya sp. Prado105]|jgi:peptide/nickel transport system permease protein|nr:ABC transporter permease [Leptolyngbya sp. Prado105]